MSRCCRNSGGPPGDLAHLVRYDDDVFWNRQLCDRWPLVLKLSERVEVEWFRQVPPISELGENDIGVSGIGTIAAARVAPRGRPGRQFHRSLDVCALHEAPSVDRNAVERWRGRRLGAPNSVGLVGLHRA